MVGFVSIMGFSIILASFKDSLLSFHHHRKISPRFQLFTQCFILVFFSGGDGDPSHYAPRLWAASLSVDRC